MNFVFNMPEWLLRDLEAELTAHFPIFNPKETPVDKIKFSILDEAQASTETLACIQRVVERGAFTLGREVEAFEKAFSDFVGADHAVGVNSGTDAIKLALRALGIKAGDRVVVPANTFVATAGAAVELGCQIVWCDVDPVTNLIDLDKLEHILVYNDAVQAIIPVHWAGRAVDMARLSHMVSQHSYHNRPIIIEDACQALGAARGGHMVGDCAYSDAAAFSLHPLKNLHVWGDGGIITTHQGNLAEKLRLLRNHGLKDRDTVACWGVNSRLDTVQAVVGLAAIGGLDRALEKRRAIAYAYSDMILKATDAVTGIAVQADNDHDDGAWHLYQFHVHATFRDDLVRHLNERGIEARVHYPVPLYQQPCAGGLMPQAPYKASPFPGADSFCATHVTLPIHDKIGEAEIERIVLEIKRFFDEGRYSKVDALDKRPGGTIDLLDKRALYGHSIPLSQVDEAREVRRREVEKALALFTQMAKDYIDANG